MNLQHLIFLLMACAGLLLSSAMTQAAGYVPAEASGSGEPTVDMSSELDESTPKDEDDRAPIMSEELVNSLLSDAPSYFEGDIVLTEDQRAAIEAQTGEPFDRYEPQRAITRKENRLWPDGKVPYRIASSLSSKAKSAITAAINAYSASTCIQFYPRRSEKDYIYFFKGSGCYAGVGRVGGAQRISIGSGCEYKGIVMHEIFHTLGRWHEQSRPDRDQFISIKYENVKDGVKSNFFKLSTNQVKTQGVHYDYGSIMHYSAYAFSRNGKPTIEATDKSISRRVMGQRSKLSTRDLQHIDALYCDVAQSASWSSWGGWSSCSRTCNGGIRSRSRTCQGGSNCPGSSSQEQSCNTQSCPVAASWSMWGSWSGCSATCGGGRQARTRQCRNGNICIGTATQYRDCNKQTCSVSSGKWSSWSVWSECSASCEGGRQTRTRQCLSVPCNGQSSVARNCNTHQCPTVSSGIAGLKHEGCYRVLAGDGLFLLEGRVDILRGESPFQRTRPVEKCGEAATELSYSVMAVSAGYCISGNNRLSNYKKSPASQCKDGKGAYARGTFYMDVYTITDPAAFKNSDVPQTLRDSTANEQGLTPSSGLVAGMSTETVVIATLSILLSIL